MALRHRAINYDVSGCEKCRDPSSNPMQGTISFSFLLFAINKARNIISNIIMIFNINSTRGQTLLKGI